MTSIHMPSGKIITPDALFVRHRYARNNFDVETPTSQLEGLYKMVVRRADGSVKQETEWFKNLVTDAGLDRWMSGQAYLTYDSSGQFKVGTGTAAPAANQNSLVQQVAASNGSASGGGIVAATAAPWWGGYRWAARFNAGSLNGQALTEVGIGWDSTGCFSRALITPDGVNPGAITVLADETLDVIYELRVFPNTADATGTIVLAGNNYNFVCRPAEMGSTSGISFSGSVGNGGYFDNNFGVNHYVAIVWQTGTLGGVNGQPSGSGASSSSYSTTVAAYSNGSFQRQHSATFGLTNVNTPNGDIALMQLYIARVGAYQYQFTPAIPKGPSKTLRLDFNTTLARRP
jgi:hypothetical protein